MMHLKNMYILLSLFTLYSCSDIKEDELVGEYVENNKAYRDTIWILSDGTFLQKVYDKKDKLIYNEKSNWSLKYGTFRIDLIYTPPDIYVENDTLDLIGGSYTGVEVSRRNGRFAIFLPYWVEDTLGVYFYKIK